VAAEPTAATSASAAGWTIESLGEAFRAEAYIADRRLLTAIFLAM
jgi:hypothetical protein